MPTTSEFVRAYLKSEQDKARERFDESTMSDITEAGLSGMLWYSQKERNILKDRGRDRTFGELPDGRIVEYTELISMTALQENPEDTCGFDDAVFLGMGKFHHWEKCD